MADHRQRGTEKAAEPRPLYRPGDFFMLRAATLPSEDLLAATELGGARTETTSARLARLTHDGRVRLRKIAERPMVEQALHVASTSLAAGLARLAAAPRDDKRTERVYSSLVRYVTRMATRPTPYGLFAGVGMGRFEATTSTALGPGVVAATRTRADVGWLLELVKDIENDENLVAALRVVVNPMLYRVGGRAVLPFADVHGQSDNRLVGFRRTAPVEVALRAANLPGTTYADLVEAIRAEMPGATTEQARALVGQLWELHVLISDLRPALTVALPEQDLVKRLDGIEAATSVQSALREVREHATRIDDALGGAAVPALRRMTARQSELTPGFDKETYQLDAALSLADDRLSKEIGETAADVADVLTRLGGSPRRHHHLVEYHSAFLERYGLNAEVPVLELLSPESGLDAPPGYQNPPRTYPLPTVPDEHTRSRDALFGALAAESLYQCRKEIELTDDLLERVSTWRPGPERPRPRPALDLYCQIAARSADAIDRGDWRMVVAPLATADGGRTFGRFFDLFGEKSLRKLSEFARAEEALCPDLTFAELNYVTSFGRGGNVAIHPALRRYEICVNTSPSLSPDRQVALADIVVGATAERFYLRSKRLGRELYVTQSHLLSAVGAPNVCRLLLELSQDGFTSTPFFDWGVAGSAPYLPRVTRGRVVLYPAQWRLSSKLLSEHDGESPESFHEAVQKWRTSWSVPRYVYLVWLDNRLLLDLEHPLFTEELRAELARIGRQDAHAAVLVHEMLPGFDELWLKSKQNSTHVNEIVVPLLARDQEVVRRSPVAVQGAVAEDDRTANRRKLVGCEWVYLKLYSATAQQDDIIVTDLPELTGSLTAEKTIDRWFYIRYLDPQPHLRIRVRVRDRADVGQVITRCAEWAHGVIASGLASDLAFVSYDRELERYGGAELIDTIEELFTANSEASVELVKLRRMCAADVDVETLCVLAVHKLSEYWGADLRGDVHARATPDVSDAARKHFRRVRPVLCDLLAPWDDHPDEVARRYAGALDRALERQREVAARAGDLARELARTGRLTGTEQTILGSLLHMQVNRLLGIDQEREKACHELWALGRRAIERRPVR
ncbi:lantibiotic dehydratase [Amycolatopsis sp. NPDC059021]|uniref:lantibiotic dehydratase n=1 Tax=Amycolatopsis sp. NPDC059021 TaxID=3346704 RepID=UPI003672438C